MSVLEAPKYRVRLFLSVDLVGSTGYKSRTGQTSLEWLKAFQKFYGEFPSLFGERYKQLCGNTPEICGAESDCEPKVWKTIGDEILFVNRVYSITHLGAYVSAFSDSLKEFGREIHSAYGLNTKGNGWVAAFPSPNCSIGLGRDGVDPLSGHHDLLTEDFEAEADKSPHLFDFLGKGIDGGFRIARNSTVDTFTISPALAFLLCRAKRNNETTGFNCEFQFHEPQQLKGVLGGIQYPIISIDTNRDQEQKDIHDLQAELLQQPANADFSVLAKYLEKFILYHGIEMPMLKLSCGSAEVAVPKHYEDYIGQWNNEVASLRSAEALEVEAGEQDPRQKAEGAAASLDDALKAFSTILDTFAKRQPKIQEDDKGE